MEKLHQIIIRNKKQLQKGKNIEKENKELRKKQKFQNWKKNQKMK